MPAFDELAEMVDNDGNCWVENFVVGREGYGNVLFPGMTNVAGLNLDEICKGSSFDRLIDVVFSLQVVPTMMC